MAVLVEGFSVIVRRDAIARKYPGGWDAFARDVPNRTLCADERIARVGFMNSGDMRAYIGFLERRGLVHLRDEKAVDVTIASQQGSHVTMCDWISFFARSVGSQGETIFVGRYYDKALWKAGLDGDSRTEPVATPAGWSYERSLSRDFGYAAGRGLKERLRFLGTMGGMDVYEDLETGKTVYVGRTGSMEWVKHRSS